MLNKALVAEALRLYLVTDSSCLRQTSLVDAIELAIQGGVTMVQLREKNLDSKDFFQQALAVKQLCHQYHVPLIINDRIDIALAIDADGVHVGQSDLPCHIVRKLLGDNKIIGVSARNTEQARQAQQDGADYLGVGAVFTTSTKPDAKTVTIDTVAAIRSAVDIPMVLIGGINMTTLPDLATSLLSREVKVDGIAVVSAILAQPDIYLASQDLKTQSLRL